ncbi:SDR family NAD(P)-dependent oxidoreductase [Cryptosporangium aurantiacum]|uniref:Short chain dehydrogenase n=1 Tax=Cryptosporangium aurantiacum TaxID=134849 RepID=A0A1M7RFR9_9ACTN|nr:SDR family NAD(P)-dependent oxidoreductase [Cryptosporangium aurantiacum]SHN45080.1 short chain dehydrogenase [Cryptosporangium aurantiacum]
MPTLAVFGAGPAFGLSVAHRFGREGYAVTLVGRNPATLEPLTASLRAADVSATAVVADLTDRNRVREVARTLRAPDVTVYSPGDVSRLPVAALDLDAEELESWLPLNLLSPVALTRALLPGLLARGSGSLVVALGSSVRTPDPVLASSAVPQSALLQYLHSVAASVGPRGVDVHAFLIGSLIERSAAAALVDQGHFDEQLSGVLPRISPDVLADRVYSLVGRTDTVETAAA